tara:strand:- start:287 stop:1393 length:1107 start_codon:yes stop_codon:yes gene_type:complete
MKVIINASNIVVGGGIQVSLSILNEFKKISKNSYHVFLSLKLLSQINKFDYPENFTFYEIEASPSNLKTRRRIIQRLDGLEREINPSVVFSVFGPSYWKPKAIHISGFADGWCYNPNSIAFKELGIIKRIKTRLLNKYKNYYIKSDTDYLIVETDVAKKNIVEFLNYNKNKIYVVGNTYSSHFNMKVETFKKSSNFKLITISAFYKHKNLEIINSVTKFLRKKSNNKYQFFLTIDKEAFENVFGNNPDVINLGPQKAGDCPQLYAKYDALFLPTLLETFTASYPEAMKMNKPILTSNLDFAIDLCRDAAHYFNPKNASEIADKIIEVSENRNVYLQLIKNGKERLKSFETPKTRAEKYLKIFNEVISH